MYSYDKRCICETFSFFADRQKRPRPSPSNAALLLKDNDTVACKNCPRSFEDPFLASFKTSGSSWRILLKVEEEKEEGGGRGMKEENTIKKQEREKKRRKERNKETDTADEKKDKISDREDTEE